MKIYAARNTANLLKQMVGQDLWVLAEIKADYYGIADAPYRAWIQLEDLDDQGVCTFLEHKLFIGKTHIRNKAYIQDITPIGEFLTTAELDGELERLRSLHKG